MKPYDCSAQYQGHVPRYMQSNWLIKLTENQHGIVARYSIKNGVMMDSAIQTLFEQGLALAIQQVMQPVLVRSGIKECQPTNTGSVQPERVAA